MRFMVYEREHINDAVHVLIAHEPCGSFEGIGLCAKVVMNRVVHQ